MLDACEKMLEILKDIEYNGTIALDKNGKPALDECGNFYRVATPDQKRKMTSLEAQEKIETNALKSRIANTCKNILGVEKFDKLQKEKIGMDYESLRKKIDSYNF